MARVSGIAEAKKKRKHKKKPKKAKPNAFGCLEVGDACKSEDQCCSGMCTGKNGQRKCRAHDTGTCDQDSAGICEAENPYSALCDDDCVCFRTTAGSNFCASTFRCVDCQTDADCLALGFPSGSACAPLSVGMCRTACEGDTACVVPCGYEPPEQ